LSIWVTQTGTPMGQFKTITLYFFFDNKFSCKHTGVSRVTNLVADTVAAMFPGRRITPTFFRRGIVTYLVKNKLNHEDLGSFDAWVKKHAALINTSPAVLHAHYDRFSMALLNSQSLQHVNDSLKFTPEPALQKTMDELSGLHNLVSEANKAVATKVLDHKYDVLSRSPSFLVLYQGGEQKWVPLNQMHGLEALANEYRASTTPTPNKKKKKKKDTVASKPPTSSNQIKPLPFLIDDDDDFAPPKLLKLVQPTFTSTEPPVTVIPNPSLRDCTIPPVSVSPQPSLNPSGHSNSNPPVLPSHQQNTNTLSSSRTPDSPMRRMFANIFGKRKHEDGEIGEEEGQPKKKICLSLSGK